MLPHTHLLATSDALAAADIVFVHAEPRIKKEPQKCLERNKNFFIHDDK